MSGSDVTSRFIGPALYQDLHTGRSIDIRLRIDSDCLELVLPDETVLDRWSGDVIRPLRNQPQPTTTPLQTIRLSIADDAAAAIDITSPIVFAALEAAFPTVTGPPHEKQRPHRLGLWSAGALVSLGLILFVVIPHFADQLAGLVPPRLQERMGTQVTNLVILALDRSGQRGGCQSETGSDALNKLVDDLKLNGAPKIRIHVVKSGIINALAIPGGNIILTSTLIEEAGSSAALQGVIAHEIGHIALGHAMPRVIRLTMVTTVISLLTGDVFFGVSSGAVEQLIASSFTRSQEAEADKYAADALIAAQIPLEPMAGFFDTLDDIENKLEEEGGSNSRSWFSTHPETRSRAALLRARAKEVGDMSAPATLTEEEWDSLLIYCRSKKSLQSPDLDQSGN